MVKFTKISINMKKLSSLGGGGGGGMAVGSIAKENVLL